MSNFVIELIRNSRLVFGEAPRTFDADMSRYLNVSPPLLGIGLPKYQREAYRNHRFLLEQGHVVWASLVLAKRNLFSSGRSDGGGIVVFCPKLHLHDDVARLIDVATELGGLAGKPGRDANERELGRKLQGNISWFPPEPAPASCGGDGDIFVSTVLVVRKHIPRRFISANQFPILVHPEKNSLAILPERYWPDELRDN